MLAKTKTEAERKAERAMLDTALVKLRVHVYKRLWNWAGPEHCLDHVTTIIGDGEVTFLWQSPDGNGFKIARSYAREIGLLRVDLNSFGYDSLGKQIADQIAGQRGTKVQ